MTSISKRHQPSMTSSIWNEKDRISDLPDSVLVYILSFLPTKYAVGTSILSKRWKYLWTYVARLDFNDDLLHYRRDDSAIQRSFMRFVDHVLLVHNLSHVQIFSLVWRYGVDLNRVNTWITIAISRFVQELHLQICTKNPLHLPSELFTCETLVVLKLLSAADLSLPSSVCFPSLKILHVSLYDPDNELTEKFFRCCPVLEDLFIQARVGDIDERNFIICTPALKCFKMELYTDDDWVSTEDNIVVSAPNLESLSLHDDYLACYLLKNLSSLVKAEVSVGEDCIRSYPTKEHAAQVFVLLKEIYNVKFLTLGAGTMEVVDFAFDNCALPVFRNLTHLEVSVECISWKRLPHLLNNSMPNLENLVLNKYRRIYLPNQEVNWIEAQGMPMLHLKDIEVTGIMERKDDLKMIRYFLENAEVLIKMTIATYNLANRERFLKRLAMFRRSSKTCQIQIS